MAEIEHTQTITGARSRPWVNAGPPSSGTSGTLANQIGPGELLFDSTNGVMFVNEGTKASPYYTPTGFDQLPLFSIVEDFKSQVGKAVANTDAEAVLNSGLRIFGQGIEVNDSGLVVQTAGEGGAVGRLTTTDEASHVAAIGGDAGTMQPDQHQLLVIDIELTNVSAITARSLFVGFLGTAADALDPAVTGATTVATLVQDDLAGLWMDAGLTDGDRIFGVHNKSDEAASQDLTADGDTEVDLAAAGTYQRFRVEINADGDMTAFIDKAQIYAVADALDADEECSPVAYIETTTTANISADFKRYASWAYR